MVLDYSCLSMVAWSFRALLLNGSGLWGYTMRSEGSTLGAWLPHGVIW